MRDRLGAGDRLREAVEQLDLSAQQRTRVAELFDSNQARIDELRQQARDNPAEARRQMAELAQGIRAGLADILTPQQQAQLRNLMQRSAQPPPAPPPPPPPPPSSPPPRSESAESTSTTSASSQPDIRATDLLMAPRVSVGAAAPPISAVNLDGRPITLESLPRKPLVMIFGSHSCPSFRQRLPQLKELADTYQRRVHFVIIYTREAHAIGEWEVQRNKDERIEVHQPADLPARRTLAAEATRPVSKVIDVAVDVMSDDTARAYGLFPNGAVVLSRDRTIIGFQKWVDPFALAELIGEATRPSR